MRERRTGVGASCEGSQALRSGATRFKDRRDAGRRLAAELERFRDERPVVVGIARGGVPVAAEVAHALGAPLDVAVVRKIGAPGNRELAIGAVAECGVHVLSEQIVRRLRICERELRALIAAADVELSRQLPRYRGGHPADALTGATAILVDDGLATGCSARAALRALRRRGAERIVLAVPVAAPGPASALRSDAEEVVCVAMPAALWAVGLCYEDFRPTGDDEVMSLLAGVGQSAWAG